MGLPARRIHQQFSAVGSLYRLVDGASVASGLGIAVWLAAGKSADYLLLGASGLIVHYLLAEIAGMYRSWRGVSTNRETVAALCTWLLSFAVIVGIGFATGYLAEYSRPILSTWLGATALLLIVSRGVLRTAQKSFWLRGMHTNGCAIVG